MKEILQSIFSGLGGRKNGLSSYEYYDDFFSRFNDVESYTLLLKTSCKESVFTREPVTFSHSLGFGSEAKAFLRKLGKPCRDISQSEPFSRRILFYKLIVGGHRVKCELHFHKNKLFFFSYIFSYLSAEEKQEIMDLLCRKYTEKSIDFEKSYIMDAAGNVIYVSDIVDFSINYVNMGNSLFREHNPEPVKMKTKKNQNKIRERELFRML